MNRKYPGGSPKQSHKGIRAKSPNIKTDKAKAHTTVPKSKSSRESGVEGSVVGPPDGWFGVNFVQGF